MRAGDARGTTPWDVVVVGAGPAGSMVACELGVAGLEVLLVDRMPFPRHKVCGACLSRGAVEVLADAGFGGLLDGLGTVALTELRVSGPGWISRLPLSGGAVVSRSDLDHALAKAAQCRGATFLPGTRARLGPTETGCRWLTLGGPTGETRVRARVVVAADGLGGPLLQEARVPPEASPGSRVGLGALFDSRPAGYEPGVVYMAVGDVGYVGVVAQADGRLNVAAAVDPGALRTRGPRALVGCLLAQAGLPGVGELHAAWRGTPALTRSPSMLGAERVFRVGDAAGYVEPFTGEGMCWALSSARALSPLVARAVDAWTRDLLDEWGEQLRRRLAPAQRLCRTVAWGLRRPRLTRAAFGVLGAHPSLAALLLARAARPPFPRSAEAP